MDITGPTSPSVRVMTDSLRSRMTPKNLKPSVGDAPSPVNAENFTVEVLKSEGWKEVGTCSPFKEYLPLEDGLKSWTAHYSSYHSGWGMKIDMPSYGSGWTDPPPRDNQCPHCLRDWHPTELTEELAKMWDSHEFREDYDSESDTSRVVCVGAEAQGPAVRRARAAHYPVDGTILYHHGKKNLKWLHDLVEATQDWDLAIASIDAKTWLPDDPIECPKNLPVKWGQDNWKPWEDKPWITADLMGFGCKALEGAKDFPVPDTKADINHLKKLAEKKGLGYASI